MYKQVYIIVNESRGRFKIGFSKDPAKRVKSLQTGNDDVIKLYYERTCFNYSKVESSLKKDYKEYRTQGEWFETTISFVEIEKKVTFYENMYNSLISNPFI